MASFASYSFATAKYVDALIKNEGGGSFSIVMPAGATLVDIEVYDDLRGIKPFRIGPKSPFKLEPGQGFNYIWKDSAGSFYGMITPQSDAPDGLQTDCSWIDPKTGQPACKYLYPKSKK